MEFVHRSIMLDEVLSSLSIKPDGIYVDGTLGGGGHSYEIASRLTEGGRLIGIDQDEEAIRAAGKRLASFSDRTSIIHSNYANMRQVLLELGISKVNGILLGTFTAMERGNCRPDIVTLVKEACGPGMPVAKTAEIGHGGNSKAIVIGREIALSSGRGA